MQATVAAIATVVAESIQYDDHPKTIAVLPAKIQCLQPSGPQWCYMTGMTGMTGTGACRHVRHGEGENIAEPAQQGLTVQRQTGIETVVWYFDCDGKPGGLIHRETEFKDP